MVCDTCDNCPEENVEKIEDGVAQRKVEEFMQEFHEHGIECGQKIAEIVEDIHPFAIAIIPLYRSCVVIEQNEDEKKEGIATIHSYADPHWLGGDITIEALRSDEFHSKFAIQGLRHGPEISMVKPNNYQKMIKDMLDGMEEHKTGQEASV